MIYWSGIVLLGWCCGCLDYGSKLVFFGVAGF